ncbi:hypothetical protein ALC62_11109 [Cyphomyrmex costatus]|uniref:Uncharacterized protein n=1 Tax=Cyphomyrmex costatus TaxID=456900 RepID=A0A151ICQ4_9HYME|nr:hypothetical protein ALC62_11109 [Cyphomyrmex costatus]
MEKSIFLTGQSISLSNLQDIIGNNLPSNKQVLNLFFDKRDRLSLKVKQACNETASDIKRLWDSANIPSLRKDHVVKKLKTLYDKWSALRKNEYHKQKQLKKHNVEKEAFTTALDQVFFIAQRNIFQIISEDRKQFLLSHNLSDDVRKMTNVETSENNETSRNTMPCRRSTCDSQATAISGSNSSESQTTNEIERTYSNFEDSLIPPIKRKLDVMTPEVVAALDRGKVSDRNAMHIICALTKALNVNINDVNLSRSTIYRRRIKIREQIANDLKENLQVAAFLVVHWDGKLLPDDIFKFKKVDRLPVVISGLDTEQLLGVPKLDSGTGKKQSESVVEMLNEWNVEDRVKALCFDTTPSNTGPDKGTCVLIEKSLKRKLFYLGCRHHILELVLKNVFQIYWPATSAPTVSIFIRFQENWDRIDVTKFKPGINDPKISQVLSDKKDEILNFTLNFLQIRQPRDDYKELLELTIIFLGKLPPNGIKFKIPGAVHHARWLSKAIYGLKMYLFREEFRLTNYEVTALCEFCLFIVTFYIKWWYTAPFAIQAPYNDLMMIQDFITYEAINDKILKASQCKLANHLWYLSENLAGIALMDDRVPNELKRKMIKAMNERHGTDANSNKFVISENNIKSLAVKDLSDFVSRKSRRIFEEMSISCSFLETDPKEWDNNNDFLKCVEVFKSMKVVNDIAERGVALIEHYNSILTRNEEQKQFLVQVVQEHRKQYPNCNKSLFMR